MTDLAIAEPTSEGSRAPTSLGTDAARPLATTTKSVPQSQQITSRWLLRILPWVDVPGGEYRVNRRLVYTLGDGRITFVATGPSLRVVPQELRELSFLRSLDDDGVLGALAGRFVQREHERGEVLVERGQPADHVVLVAHGKVEKVGAGKYGEQPTLGVLTDGDHFGSGALIDREARWDWTVRAMTPTTVLTLSRSQFEEVATQSDALRRAVRQYEETLARPQNRYGEAAIETASGHVGEPRLPRTFVDYEIAPRQYQLSVSQTVLRLHTRVDDLYSDPQDQFEQQLRLTVEAVREEQEHELVNNRSFGLLHNADPTQRVSTRTGPPTPDDMDDILTRRKKTRCFVAHSKAIAAFGRECSRRGVYPDTVEVMGARAPGWRNVPILSCNKIPITSSGTTSILAFRTGEEDQGVIGLHQTGLPDEHEPGLNVRRMDLDDKAVGCYLVSAYFSAAVLVPDALGILENVEVGR